MTFGYRSRSLRGSGGGFRSPRGRGSFRGRGRGSDSYFNSNRRSYSNRSPGVSYRGSNFRERDNYFHSHDRYGDSSFGRKSEEYRDNRDSAGSFNREHLSRRNDGEPDRKKLKSEIGSYKEGGASARRSYDDIEHSSRSYNSGSYFSDSTAFKSYKRDYSEFKKPLPMEHEYSDRRSSRGSRGGRGGGISRPTAIKTRSAIPALMRRTIRINKLSSATRLQQLLRRKKQLRIMRIRRAREERGPNAKHKNVDTAVFSDEEMMQDEEELDQAAEEQNQKNTTNSESKKSTSDVQKEPNSETEAPNVSDSPKQKVKISSPFKGRSDYIALKCIHCRSSYRTFNVYQQHLRSFDHKKAMERLLQKLKMKLNHLRSDQRKDQRVIDEQSEGFAKTSYCKLCKLNYKQTKSEHFTSDYHVNMREFLKPSCSVCNLNFQTPILYEHHRCTLTHIKRKAFLEKERARKEKMDDDENNDEDNFMVLDSVGSADESNDDMDELNNSTNKESTSDVMKIPKVVGSEFIKKVTCYYCKLCQLCINYKSNKSQDELLLLHCRSLYHLKRYSAKKEVVPVKHGIKDDDNDIGELDDSDEKFWGDGDNHKPSEDEEEDSQSGNRYDRFGHSDEKENVSKQIAVDPTDGSEVSLKQEMVEKSVG